MSKDVRTFSVGLEKAGQLLHIHKPANIDAHIGALKVANP